MSTFAAAKAVIALAIGYQYVEKERFSLTLRGINCFSF
jgi:hypothetical protein